MKKTIFTLICFMIVAGVNAQQSPNGTQNSTVSTSSIPDPLTMKQTTHDFGKIPQGRPTTYVFEVVNSGNTPLRIENIQAACGCTTPVWSKDEIAPGATSKITVGYNAYAEGGFEKTMTIQYGQNQTKVLVIKGFVYKVPPASAPENSSVKLLKQLNQ